jgi:hypothetical protein
MIPCEQVKEISDIKDRLKVGDCDIVTLRIKQAEIAGDVTHIKQKLDNGMSSSIARIDENLVALKPVIEHHATIVKRIEDIGWAISTSVTVMLVLGLLGVIVWAITKGFRPNL